MNTRLSKSEIQAFENILAYDRFNVHVHGEKLKVKIDELTAMFDISQDEVNPRLKKLYQQLSLYFAFYERNKEQAAKYLKEFNACCKADLEKAEASSLIGYVDTIDPTFKDEKIFTVRSLCCLQKIMMKIFGLK